MTTRAGELQPSTSADDLDPRFQALVQSPLRAGLLRFLWGQRTESFDIPTLMQTFGRLRLDLENCLRELVAIGLAEQSEAGAAARFQFHAPDQEALRALLEEFLQRRPTIGPEDRSPAVRRFRELIGSDDKMPVVFEWIRTAAKSDIAVLILGPTGSGKELVARMIHELSRRGAHRLQAVNCAALPESLFESELFGYEKGAFTGAQERKLGRLELANRGTLFLDEVGDLTLIAQAKLLRALEERRIERLGGSEPIAIDFRLVTSTNKPIDMLVREGQFREDLFYRINAFSIRLPSLRERAQDIPILAQRALARHCESNNLPSDARVLSKEALDLLSRYHWPGNIRELESTLSRAAMSTQSRVLRPVDIELLHARDAVPSLAGEHLQSVIATLTNDESVELFFPLALLGTPLVIFATMALLLFRFLTTGARGRSRAATEGAPACTCPLGAGLRGTLDARDTALPAARLTEEQRLRRRYIAGELTDSEFQLAIMMLGKERVTRGQLSLSEYELELDRLLSRARVAAKTDVLQAKPPAADGA